MEEGGGGEAVEGVGGWEGGVKRRVGCVGMDGWDTVCMIGGDLVKVWRHQCMEGVQEEAFYRQWCPLLYSAVSYIYTRITCEHSNGDLTSQLLPKIIWY